MTMDWHVVATFANLSEVLGVTPYERDLAALRCDGRNRARGRF